MDTAFKRVAVFLAGVGISLLIAAKSPQAAGPLRMHVEWNRSQISQDTVDYYWGQLWINGIEQSQLYFTKPSSGLGQIPGRNTIADSFNYVLPPLFSQSNLDSLPTSGFRWRSTSGTIYVTNSFIYAVNPLPPTPRINIERAVGTRLMRDQWAELQTATAASGKARWGVGVRLDSLGSTNGFYCMAQSDSIFIIRRLASVETYLASKPRVTAAADRVHCEIVGKTLKFLMNGIQEVTVTDTNFSAAQYKQVGLYLATNLVDGTAIATRFAAGDLTKQFTEFDVPAPRVGEQADYVFKVGAFSKGKSSKRATFMWRRNNGVLVPVVDQDLGDSVGSDIWIKFWAKKPPLFVDTIRLYRREYVNTKDTTGTVLSLIGKVAPRDTIIRLPAIQRGVIYGFYYTITFAGVELPAQKLFRGKMERTWP